MIKLLSAWWRCSVWWALGLLVTVSQGPAGAADFYRTRWALLIGVGQFKSPGMPPLQFCESNVAAVRSLLTERFGFPADHVVSLINAQATKESIVSGLNRLSDRRTVSAEDAVLVYFTGRGHTVPLPRGGEMGFLLPYDAGVSLGDVTDPARYSHACLGMDELRRRAGLIPAKHVLFLVDACCSGLALEGRRGVRSTRPLREIAARPVRQIIAGGLKDEKVVENPEWRHSAFTHALLNGMGSGAADFNQDGVVTGMEVATYLKDAVPRLAPQTPHYALFGGDGEFLFAYSGGAPQPEVAEAAPRIHLTDPPDLSGGQEELVVRPIGDTVTLRGMVLDSQPVTAVSVDGSALSLAPVQGAELQGLALRRPTESHVVQFQTKVQVGLGEIRGAILRARDQGGKESIRRVVVRAEAADTRKPEIRIAEIRTYDAKEHEVAWRGFTVASRGFTVASRGLTVASRAAVAPPREGESFRVAGFVGDDRSVVSVEVGGQPAQTQPATRDQLDGLGWTSGVAFEGLVTLSRDRTTEVTVTATDAADNKARAVVSLEPTARTDPDILVLEPAQTRDLRGTGLLLPKDVATLRITGLIRSRSPQPKVAVGGRPAETRPATQEDVKATGWPLPAIYFSAQVPVPASGITEGIAVEAEDANGNTASKMVLVQRQGPSLGVRFSSEKPTYRIGEQLHFLLSADREGYAYILHRQADGSLSLFLPNPVEPDSRLPAGVTRTFPNPEKEARWKGQYGLVAEEPEGTDTAYCLALPDPLPASLLQNLGALRDLGKALAAAGTQRGTQLVLPPEVNEQAIAKAADQLGGTWQMVEYEVRK